MHDCCSKTPAEPLDMPEATATTVTVAPTADRWIREYLEEQGIADHAVRLRVVRTGCMGGRGHTYAVETAPGPGPADQVHDVDGLQFVIDADSDRLLADVAVDLLDTNDGAGLVVTNSHAVGTCPCGRHDLFA